MTSNMEDFDIVQESRKLWARKTPTEHEIQTFAFRCFDEGVRVEQRRIKKVLGLKES